MMELRNHPFMRYRRARNWPPVWSLTGSQTSTGIAGEIGVLKEVKYDARYNYRCHLYIEHEGQRFIGTLLFDDSNFCWLIYNVLKSHTRRWIKDIGALDISYTL